MKLAYPARTCTTPAARSASRSTCRSTSATWTWSTATSATRTSRSWARSRTRAGPRHGRDGAASCSAPEYLDGPRGDAQPDQRQLAARVGRDDARRGPGLRRGQPGDAHDAVHPGRRDGPGHRRRGVRPDAGRGARRDGLRASSSGPGAPVVLGSFASSMSMQSGAPTFGTPEPALVLYAMAALARRLGVPFRSGGSLCASKIADAQAAYESAATLQPTVLAGVNFVLHAAGWLEGGLAIGYEKFILDADQCGMMAVFVKGIDLSENGQALDAILANEPGHALPGQRPHPGQLRDRLLPLRDRRQQQLRAVAGGRLARRRPAGQRGLEADAGRVRGAADRPGRRRGAARVHRPAQGVDARRRSSDGRCVFRRAPRRSTGRPASALVRVLARARRSSSIPLKNALDQRGVPAARRDRLGDGLAGQGHRGDGRAGRAAPGDAASGRCRTCRPGWSATGPTSRDLLARLDGGAASTGAFVVGGDADGARRLPRRAVACCGRWPSSATASPRSASRATRRATPSIPDDVLLDAPWPTKAPFADYMTTQLCFDPAAIATWLARPARRRASRLPRPPRACRAWPSRSKLLDDQRPDRGRRHAPVPRQEHPLRGPAPALRRLLPARRPAPGARPAHRRRRAGIVGLHMYTFNAVAEFETWRRRYLERLGVAVPA